MKLESFQYIIGKGWSVDAFPELDSEQTLIFVFAAPEFINEPGPIKELSQFYSKAKIIGCSSAGEIAGQFILDKSLSVAVVRFEKTTFNVVKAEINKPEDSYLVGAEIARRLNASDLRSIFVLSEGLQVNGSELVKGLNTAENTHVIITGGLAGDGSHFKQTWEIYNSEIFKNQVIAVGFYGDHLEVGHASRGGWDIFGPERRITRATNNILYELDGQPALALYKEYLGERANGLPATGLLYPLAIRKDIKDAGQLVRTILAINEDNQSLTFAGDVPTGYLAQLMRANFDRLISSASDAGESAMKMMSDDGNNKHEPVLAIAISCVGRRLLLGERTEEETESILETLPIGSKQVGFYSYGEISPYTTGRCDLHNQTMTLTTFYEH